MIQVALLSNAHLECIVTRQGRDYLVSITTERFRFVLFNVHLQPESSIRDNRARLTRLQQHWPSYPDGLGAFVQNHNTCEDVCASQIRWPLRVTEAGATSSGRFSVDPGDHPA